MHKPLIIGITGGSGSGKTTFINRLRKTFKRAEVCIISQDDYYRLREEQKVDNEGVTNFDLPKSINKEEFVRDVKKLISGKKVERMEYTFNNEKSKAKTLSFYPAPIIIVEGIFVFHFKRMKKLFDLKVFLHAKENLKVIRRIKRDQIERNYPIDDVLYRYEKHVMPTFEKYIKPYMDEADLVINNNDHFEMGLEVLLGFIRQKLTEIKK
ncbi:MAG: P-loop NTPase fold protein [Bacteroidetes bacterium]|jgi:uridine kinase|nr:P-loop NTPase fold protein [Bacteroidota bacterium]MDF1865986.1 P-loop NTPase fold protein [Saprospiraceae bacterium]